MRKGVELRSQEVRRRKVGRVEEEVWKEGRWGGRKEERERGGEKKKRGGEMT